MIEHATLTLAFLQRHPESAARSLAAMDPADAAAFLGSIPTRFGAAVIGKIGSWRCAQIAGLMEPQPAAALLQAIDYRGAAAILRLIPLKQRGPVLEGLPKRLRADFESSLSFPADTVGAWMNPAIVTLEPSASVSEALALARRSTREEVELLFLTTPDHRLSGRVAACDLLRASESSSLAALARPATTTLSARSRLSSIAGLPDWDEFGQLPVLSRKKHLIGALSRAALRRGLGTPAAGYEASGSVLAGPILDAFLAAGSGVTSLLAGIDSPASNLHEGGKR